MYKRPTAKLQERLALRQAVLTILPYSVINRLSVIGLQLGRRYRQAVDEEHQIDGIVRALLRVVHLAHHSKPVLLVVFLSDRVHRGCGLESAHGKFRRGLFKAASEHGQQSAAVFEGLLQGVDQTVQQGALGPVDLIFRGVLGHNARPLFGLRCLQPGEDVLRDEGALLVVAGELLFVEPTV